ncbi:ubiquinol-cytochrome-c reductase complex assembly factor 2-like [Hydractinia symbiolongicarpus]|uniref:ubiquinol-cytochrome-c reductase complex assembly factor 2-like n=1 Tax=Hydractinia symbiolongicarpus TaxID=13093 RepID=UPI00254C1145|nr:ubiquinol-cytochrome-c reductase complex assembly factor 2-like [Hydractinia symbiolongicarpus]
MTGIAKEGLGKIYKDFLRVCEKWPIDKTRSGRDFGEHLRINFDTRLKNEKVDHNEAKRTVDALMKISTNYYRDKYPRVNNTAYSLQDKQVYREVLSNEGQAQVQPHKTWWERMYGSTKLGERMREEGKKK